MKTPKKPATAKATAKFKDLKSKKNPTGGAFDASVKTSLKGIGATISGTCLTI